jgi:hypothetical protein
MVKTNKRASVSKNRKPPVKNRPTTKSNNIQLLIKSNRSSKVTKKGKEKRSYFSFEFVHTTQPKVPFPASKKALPQPKGNWVQFWLGIMFNALFIIIKFLLEKKLLIWGNPPCTNSFINIVDLNAYFFHNYVNYGR